MKRSLISIFFLITILLTACRPDAAATPVYSRDDLVGSSASTPTPQETIEETELPQNTPTPIAPTPTPTENPFATLYGCEMQLNFQSGPLESKTTNFKVLSQDYFRDKGDKFDPGKGTSIYYQFQHYFILHSSFVNGNILRPMEAEFIRKYLEYWGESGDKYVEGQIESLIGSEVTWICDGETIFHTRIDSIARLSHEASQDLWMNPDTLEQILTSKEGVESEWLGGIEPTTEPHMYIGFCGWGPQSAGDYRFTYFRYVLRFTVL